jgi:hypothetical protein
MMTIPMPWAFSVDTDYQSNGLDCELPLEGWSGELFVFFDVNEGENDSLFQE